jgi:hypothetical protein
MFAPGGRGGKEMCGKCAASLERAAGKMKRKRTEDAALADGARGDGGRLLEVEVNDEGD